MRKNLRAKIKNSIINKQTPSFLLILFVGIFLRVFKPEELFLYGHDQELTGWFIRDVLVNNHLRLIGQETSTAGVFIGPLFYYLSIPFYLLSKMDPIGGVWFVTLLGIFAIISVYFVFSKAFGEIEGLIASLIYSVSFYTVFNDREVVPTMPVILWTVWFIYAMHLLLTGEHKKSVILLAVLTALIWHLNFALILPLPLIIVGIYFSKKKFEIKNTTTYIIIALLMSLPLIFFELRHNYIQINAIIASLTTNQHDVVSGFDKLVRVINLLSKNVYGLFMGNLYIFTHFKVFVFIIALLVFLGIKKVLTKEWFIVFSCWILLYIVFFSTYSKIVSEYYLNGVMIVFIAIASSFMSYLIKNKNTIHWGVIVLSLFVVMNLNRFFTAHINASGYKEKKQIVAEIKDDMRKHDYPCMAISYITDPGYNLGYRYFYWLEDLHVNHPDSGSPVYTIVFPLKDMFKVDRTFGAIGLIYPDYKRYTKDDVSRSCVGENPNITDPMWGLTL